MTLFLYPLSLTVRRFCQPLAKIINSLPSLHHIHQQAILNLHIEQAQHFSSPPVLHPPLSGPYHTCQNDTEMFTELLELAMAMWVWPVCGTRIWRKQSSSWVTDPDSQQGLMILYVSPAAFRCLLQEVADWEACHPTHNGPGGANAVCCTIPVMPASDVGPGIPDEKRSKGSRPVSKWPRL